MTVVIEPPDDDYYEYDEPDEPDGPYPPRRLRRYLVRAVALMLVVGMLLAFPLGYLLDAQLRNQHVEAVVAIVEAVVVVVIVAALRGNRRPL